MTEGLGIESAIVDGNDVEASYNATRNAVNYIKKKNKPYFLELTTYRWREHCGPSFDNNIGYRTEAEFNEWKKKDPISSFEKKLIQNGEISTEKISLINKQILAKVNKSFDFALNAPFPNEENAYKDLFAK
jgi:pyruvate dehydrogenase E1 component alpha subunit